MGRTVQQTSDGGYVLAGGTIIKEGRSKALLIKTDEHGIESWNRTFGDSAASHDVSEASVRQTLDAGFILVGSVSGKRSLYGGETHADAWLIKTDANGNEQWNTTFGGSIDEFAYTVQQTSDGGFIIAGRIRTYDAEAHWMGDDAWLVKVSAEQGEPAKAPRPGPKEKVSEFETVLAIAIFLMAYVAARKRT